MNKNKEVTQFLDDLSHPLRNEIERLRDSILQANNQVTENIKWNGPNFIFEGEDRITMRVHPPKQIQLIFHRGAKVKEQPKDKLIEDSSNLLEWRSNDRAIITFKTAEQIEANKDAFQVIIERWLAAN